MAQPEILYFEIYQNGTLVRTDQCSESAIKLGSHAKSHVAIDDPDVGRAHAMVEKTDAGVFVIDLGSGRGTLVNGERVNKRELTHRDKITLGSTEIIFLTHDEKAAAVAEARERMAIDPATNRPRDEVLYARRFLARPAATDGSVELAMLYNDFVLAEEIYAPTKDITLGSAAGCTFLVEHASVGESHTLVSGGATPTLNLADGMTGELYVGTERRPLSRRESLPLGEDTRAKIVVGDVTFFVHRSTRPAIILPWERKEATPLLFGLFSAGIHALLWLLVMFLPPGVGDLALDAFGARDRFVQVLIEDIQPEPEPEPEPTEQEEEQGGERAAEDEGRAGDEQAPDEDDRRMALEGDLPPGEIELAMARDAVQDRGALAVLNQVGPAAMFGTGLSGSDALVAIGAMGGSEVGASYGSRGLGSYGGGIGGGGRFIGGGPLGAGGFGIRGGRAGGDGSIGREGASISREARVPTVQIGSDVAIEGQLDRELIARVIREHRREVRACYEAELQSNPELQGLVKVAFVIAADGQVAGARISESTLGNDAVGQCIANRVRRWRFPEPRGGGTVNVNYPFVLTPG
ncbi:MAG: TonB family protein [Myxococcales bacterium]|nr:TonB family protein [Myxococcales bacterium]MCB9534235.1 TonB family protein [Myxococcales bacterium]